MLHNIKMSVLDCNATRNSQFYILLPKFVQKAQKVNYFYLILNLL